MDEFCDRQARSHFWTNGANSVLWQDSNNCLASFNGWREINQGAVLDSLDKNELGIHTLGWKGLSVVQTNSLIMMCMSVEDICIEAELS